jgi:hypothetical protein
LLTEAEKGTLRDEIKDYLNITWDDINTDKKLLGFVGDGEAYLNEIAGTQLDYIKDLKVKTLLKDYVRYVYNHSLELFEINFKRELLKLSIREGARMHAEANSETTT